MGQLLLDRVVLMWRSDGQIIYNPHGNIRNVISSSMFCMQRRCVPINWQMRESHPRRKRWVQAAAIWVLIKDDVWMDSKIVAQVYLCWYDWAYLRVWLNNTLAGLRHAIFIKLQLNRISSSLFLRPADVGDPQINGRCLLWDWVHGI